jgi:hypothetical protein
MESCDQSGDEKFWTVHVHGPDDVILFDTQDGAECYVAAIEDLTKPNGWLRASSPLDPVISAHVIPPTRPVVEGTASSGGPVVTAEYSGSLTPMLDPFNAPVVASARVDEPDELTVPRELLKSLADPDDCQFDHHGGCQAHGYISLQPGEECPQRELKRRLARGETNG